MHLRAGEPVHQPDQRRPPAQPSGMFMGMIGLTVFAGAGVGMDVDMDIVSGMAMGVGVNTIADDASDNVETQEHQHRAHQEFERDGKAPRFLEIDYEDHAGRGE